MSRYVRIQPSLINVYKDYPLHILHPETGEFVRFLPRKEEYSPSAIQVLLEKGIQVCVKLNDQKRHSGEIHEKLHQKLQGPFTPEKAVMVRDLTLQLVSEYLASHRFTDSPDDLALESIEELQRIAESYLELLDMDRSEEILRLLHKVMRKDLTTATHSVNVMVLTLRYLDRERRRGGTSWLDCAFSNGEKKPEAPEGEESVEREVLKQWALGAVLHDIGKVMVPDTILQARRKLTLDEYRFMKMHVEFGWNILSKAAPHLLNRRVVAQAILEHHERTDGSGYPLNLSKVSLPGQIIGLLDCYEALTTDKRPYREAATPLEALQILRADTLGGKFSAEAFACLVELMADI